MEGGPYLRYNDVPINKWYYQNEDLSIYSSGSGKCCFNVWVLVFGILLERVGLWVVWEGIVLCHVELFRELLSV